jgi:cell division protein FtsZ
MPLELQIAESSVLRPQITVFGVGGAGGNATNNMIRKQLEGANFVVANTDAQALEHSVASKRLQLGRQTTKGLGAGASPEVGKYAAEETIDEIKEHLQGSNMVFITAGMGGGTGTGAAPVVARAAREMDILTVAVVTKPFQFEGPKRMKMAELGLKELQQNVDTLLIIPNQNLFRVANERTTFAEAFAMADDVLHAGVRSITDLMVMPGLINLDFADVRAVMTEMGKAMMGTGEAEGERRAYEAAEAAISNPLLDNASMKGARGVLINITGGSDMTLFEVDEAANRIREEVDAGANIIFGSTFDDTMDGRIRVSVVATGIDRASEEEESGRIAEPAEVREEPSRRLFPAPQAAPKQPVSAGVSDFSRKDIAPAGYAPAPRQAASAPAAAPRDTASPYSRNAYRHVSEQQVSPPPVTPRQHPLGRGFALSEPAELANRPAQAPSAQESESPYGGGSAPGQHGFAQHRDRREEERSSSYANETPQEQRSPAFRPAEPVSYQDPMNAASGKFRSYPKPSPYGEPVGGEYPRDPQRQEEDGQGGLLSRVAKMARSLQQHGNKPAQEDGRDGYHAEPSSYLRQTDRRDLPVKDERRHEESADAASLFDKPGNDVSRNMADIPAFMRKNTTENV